jgi:hypothetical protein
MNIWGVIKSINSSQEEHKQLLSIAEVGMTNIRKFQPLEINTLQGRSETTPCVSITRSLFVLSSMRMNMQNCIA